MTPSAGDVDKATFNVAGEPLALTRPAIKVNGEIIANRRKPTKVENVENLANRGKSANVPLNEGDLADSPCNDSAHPPRAP
jgi:hypothetical protein